MIGIAIDKGADCMAKVRKAKADEGRVEGVNKKSFIQYLFSPYS